MRWRKELYFTGRPLFWFKCLTFHIKQFISLYLVDRKSFINSFYFFTNLIHLIFFLHLQSLVICLYMFRTDRSIIRRIKCLITQAASGTVPSVVDLSCVAVGVRLIVSLTPTVTEAAFVTL
jgi:hypothetical protein